ncbi:hypothetical protein G3A43_39300 [Paraburkholderia aspalathi]|nr:hypothetical protein [Paraburkholderia aspalathi]MBK3786262.1 hypothetical protein [Paraburkholderia aspalathi]
MFVVLNRSASAYCCRLEKKQKLDVLVETVVATGVLLALFHVQRDTWLPWSTRGTRPVSTQLAIDERILLPCRAPISVRRAHHTPLNRSAAPKPSARDRRKL